MGASAITLFALSVLKGIALLVSYITNNAFPQPLSEEEEALRVTSTKRPDLLKNKDLTKEELDILSKSHKEA